jgi:putative nucleotidyltransferase with HDIG domain
LNLFVSVDKIKPWDYILNANIPELKLSKGVIITERIKENLLKKGIFVIPVIKNNASEHAVLRNELVEKSYNKVREFWDSLYKKQQFDKEEFIDVSQDIAESIIDNFDEVIYIPLKKLQNFDEYTYSHSLNVSIVATLIGKSMGFDDFLIKKLSLSALLHDVGKSKVDINLINAPRGLTHEEFEHMKNHVKYGNELCSAHGINDEDVLSGLLYHHERFDGKGYLSGLKEEEIPLFGRIIAIADVYDALTSKRSYKNCWNNYKAVSHILQNSTKMFDPECVSAFVKVFGIYPPGTKILLNDYRIATVIASKRENELQPMLQIGNDIVDLSKEKSYILKVL